MDGLGTVSYGKGTDAEKPASVRLATPQDEEKLFSLLVDLWRFNKSGWNIPYRPEIVIRRIEQATRPDPSTRSDSRDQTRGLAGVIDGPNDQLIGSIGLFIEPMTWFTDAVGLIELWLYVRPGARNQRQHHRDLFAFQRWAHATIRAGMPAGYPVPFPLYSGLMNEGGKIDAMERLWRRFSGMKKVGALFSER